MVARKIRAHKRTAFVTVLSLLALAAVACGSDADTEPVGEIVSPTTVAPAPTNPPAATAVATPSDAFDPAPTTTPQSDPATAVPTATSISTQDPTPTPSSVDAPPATIAPVTDDVIETATPTPAPALPPVADPTSTSIVPATETPVDDPEATPTPSPPPTPSPTPTAVPQFAAADIIGFAHPDITVSVGTTITWTNRDGAPHTVTAGDPGAVTGEFDSGVFNLGGTYSLAFDTPGHFAYFCAIHPSMQASVTVQ